MNILEDIKNVSDAAIEKLAAQFGDLPKPLLAAIGAGDLAVERLAKLREQIGGAASDKLGDGFGSMPSGDDVKSFAADLSGKAQKIAGDIAHRLEKVATEAPGKAQQLIADLPAKAQEFSNALSRENLRSTVDGYTQFVGMVYGHLVDRGGETVAKARPGDAETHSEAGAGNTSAKPARTAKHVDSVVTDAPAKRKSAAKAAPKKAERAAKAGGSAKAGSSPKKAEPKKAAAKKPAAPAEPKKAAAKKPEAPSEPKSAADTPVTAEGAPSAETATAQTPQQ